jgi:FKBP-type peptidyl-prolyl cis-trans isomerase (trigger factor)
METNKSLINLGIICLVLSLGLVSTLGPTHAQESNVAIKVNDEIVKQSELQERIDRSLQRMKQQYGSRIKDSKKMEMLRKRIRKQVIDDMVAQLLLKTNAIKSNISVSTKEVQTQLKSQQKRFGSEERFQTALKQQNMTLDEYRQKIQEQILVEKFVSRKIGSITVSDQEAREYFSQNKKRFRTESFEEVKNRVKKFLKQRKQQEKREELIDSLREESEVDIRV